MGEWWVGREGGVDGEEGWGRWGGREGGGRMEREVGGGKRDRLSSPRSMLVQGQTAPTKLEIFCSRIQVSLPSSLAGSILSLLHFLHLFVASLISFQVVAEARNFVVQEKVKGQKLAFLSGNK